MILKKINIECIDHRTGFVLKRINTTEWKHLNRKLAVNNNLFSCEKSRTKFDKSLLASPFQIHHIRHDKRDGEWLFDGIGESKKHASRNNRFYLAFQQRSDEQWRQLTWHESEDDFQDLATRGLPLVPYPIPLKGAIDDWKTRKEDGESILNKSQKLVPIFCSKHKREYFEPMFRKEFGESKLIGIQCYSINDVITMLNLNKIKIINMSLEEGKESPLILGLNHARRIKSISNVSGSFAHSCFGCDILSERQTFLENMPPSVVKDILDTTPDDIYRYDTTEGGFNFSEEQKFWKNINLTKAFLKTVSLSEGLSPYQAILWANYNNQQYDFEVLNNKVLETKELPNALVDYIRNEKSKWAIFWNQAIEQA